MRKYIVTTLLLSVCLGSFAQVYYGLFEEGLQNNNTRLAAIENELGKKPGVCLFFMWWPNNIDVSGCNNLISKGITPIITLEPGMTYTSVISGSRDSYFRTIAGQLKQIKGTVFLRYGHEMNGNWYTWDGYHNGANAAAAANYIAAWRRIHGIINVDQEVTNVLWNWCVNGSSWPNESWNEHMDYYPGDEYVDWLGFDSYDKPYNYTPVRYKSLEDIFGSVYGILTKAVPDKPILVGEFASENYGHETDPHKLEFFTKGGPALFEKYPRIHAFSYFNVAKQNSGRWNDYRISNPATLLPIFQEKWIANVNVVSGNSGIEDLHKYKVLPETGVLRLEAENYFDMRGIKNEVCLEGGLNAGFIDSGDYFDFLVDVAVEGIYSCDLRIASSVETGKIEIRNQVGTILASLVQSTSTGGAQIWETHTMSINLGSGKQKLRVYFSGAGVNVNWLELSAAVPGSIGDITKNQLREFTIYPNPASDNITVELKKSGFYKIDVYSATGIKMLSQIVSGMKSIRLDIAGFARGVYLISATGNKNQIEKFIVE